MIIAIDTNAIVPGRVGGIENYTLGLIEALKSPGSPAESLVLLTRHENHNLFSKFEDKHTQLISIPRPQGNWTEIQRHDRAALARFQTQKSRTLHRFKVDLIHFPGNTINPVEIDFPTVLNLHDLQHRRYPEYFTGEEIANREKWWHASAHRADALMAASNFVRDDLVSELSVEASKIFVAPDAFESAFFRKPSPEQLADVKHRHKLADTFFLYPAAAWPHKNHARLIKAFKAVDMPNAQLVLTGAGQESLRSLSDNAHGAPVGLRMLGRVSTEDLVALYHLATALVFPSLYEAWSIPIMEAMACSCPVASSNVTSLPEQVGDAGLLFDPTNISAMATAMRTLATDTALRKTFIDRGAKQVRQFSTEKFLQTICRAYDYAHGAYRSKKAA
jgi:glycosyltransferase involved in cell wall biosynthesis